MELNRLFSVVGKIVHKYRVIFVFCIVLLVAFITYFRNYSNPPNLFWDENYHIASAYKYLNNVFFMEPHPPLGKLFIAWGELLIEPNKNLDTSSFLSTDYIKEVPKGFSFIGVRFFPVLFSMLSGPIFFLVLYSLFSNIILAFFFSFLYLFDNAIIVHSRGAMLDSAGIFFSLLVILYFILLQKRKHIPVYSYGILGLLTGLVLSIKLNGIIFGMLFLFLIVKELKQKKNGDSLFYLLQKAIVYCLGVVIIFGGVYYVHIHNGQKVVENKYYEASDQLKKVLQVKKTAYVINFPFQLREHLLFIPQYEKGVPKLDICKADENGSHPLTWPIGNKSINYRWEKSNGGVQYLYLQGNPAIWGVGLAGILISLAMIISRLIFKLPIKNSPVFLFILLFTSLYVVYMGLALSLPRVLYLYHYFTPLIFSCILAYLQFVYLFENKIKQHSKMLYAALFITIFLIVVFYILFSPFTYYWPITEKQFQLRNWFSWWHLVFVK